MVNQSCVFLILAINQRPHSFVQREATGGKSVDFVFVPTSQLNEQKQPKKIKNKQMHSGISLIRRAYLYFSHFLESSTSNPPNKYVMLQKLHPL